MAADNDNMLLDRKEAAVYLRLREDKLMNQLKCHAVRHLRISPHVVMFRKEDLDAWRSTWQEVQPK